MALHKVKKPNSVIASAKKKKICFSIFKYVFPLFIPKSFF